jgi:hypothetical protein
MVFGGLDEVYLEKLFDIRERREIEYSINLV